MTRLQRAGIGALIGVLLAFVLHPRTRNVLNPFTVKASGSAAYSRIQTYNNPRVAPSPEDRLGASQWMVLASQEVLSKSEVDPNELKRWIQVAQGWRNADVNNSYWEFMVAAFKMVDGKPDEATEFWESGLGDNRFQDYQGELCVSRASDLARLDGAPYAWHYAALLGTRSSAPAALIQRGVMQWRKLPKSAEEKLIRRSKVVRIGAAVRDGSVLQSGFIRGMDLIESAVRSSVLEDVDVGQRILLVSRGDFVRELRATGHADIAADMEQAFSRNSGWLGMVTSSDPDGVIQDFSIKSALSASLPSALLVTALAGLFLFAMGYGILDLDGARFLTVPVLYGLALVAGLGAWAASKSLLPGVVIAGAIAYHAIPLTAYRSADPTHLDRLYTLVTFVFGLVFSASIILWWLSLSASVVALRPQLANLGAQNLLPQTWCQVSFLSLGLILVISPIWALFYRYRQVKTLGLTLKKVGQAIACLALLGTIAATLAHVVIDRGLAEELKELCTSEPRYYYNKWTK